MLEKFWDDFEVGQQVTSTGVTITESHLVQWAGLTWDWYPLHMDEEWASNTIFEGRIAHGPLTFAMGIGLMGTTGFVGDSIIAWLGADTLRLPGPVRIGDTIHLEAGVTELHETSKPETGRATMHYTIVNQRGDTVMEYDMLFLMKRRV